MKYCKCDYDHPYLPNLKPNIVNGILICTACNLPIKCELSYLSDDPNDPEKDGPDHPAECIYIDYRVCKQHLNIAVDNVWARTLPK